MRSVAHTVAVAIGAAAVFAFGMRRPAAAASWPQHRGPGRNGITSEPSGWNGSSWPIRKLWQQNVKMGCTSPILAGGKAYAMGWQYTSASSDPQNPNGEDYVSCLDAGTGATLWTRTYSQKKYCRHHTYDESYYGGPNATPTFDASTGYLYTHGIDGDFRCLDTTQNGSVVWSMNIYDAYGIPQNPEVYPDTHNNDYGCISSPLIYGNWVILEVGSPTHGLIIGYDKKTGAKAWASELKTWAGQSPGPQLITVGGVQCLATLTLEHLVIMRLDSGNVGKTVAKADWKAGWDENHSMPCVEGANVWLTGYHYINGGRNDGASARFECTLSGITRKWKNLPCSKATGLTVYEGCAYVSSTRLGCLNASNGSKIWDCTDTTGTDSGCGATVIITGDEKLLYLSQSNNLYLAQPGNVSGTYTRLAKVSGVLNPNSGQTWPQVALAEGKILVKDKSGNLACYSTGSTSTSKPGVTTLAASNVTTSAARLNGEVTSAGGENPSVKIYWGISDGGTTAANWAHEESLGTKGTGTFYKTVSGLADDTTYYFRCYASNSAGGSWASSGKQFTTLAASMPFVDVTAPTGGVFKGKQDVTIAWHSNVAGNVKIEFTQNGGSSWQSVDPSTPNSLSYVCQLPNVSSADCSFRVSDAADGDPSGESGVFTVEQITDSDGDRLDDTWETSYFGDVTTSGGGQTDTDDDGVSDLEEFWSGTDPTVAAEDESSFACAAGGHGAAAPAALLAAFMWLLACRGLPRGTKRRTRCLVRARRF